MPNQPRYPWKKTLITWTTEKTLYISIPFTWLLPEAESLARQHNGPVVIGGPAAMLVRPAWGEVRASCTRDVLALHNPYATFTTRGCPNHCAFCAVPRIEGEFRELTNWKPAPLVCDNNLLAASHAHFRRVIDALRWLPFVDFNQGLEASLFTPWHAQQIARLRHPFVRFAFDSRADEAALVDALTIARRSGLKSFGVYVLIGFKDTPDDARYRLDRVRQLGIRPNPMRYQPLNATKKNEYVSPKWTSQLLHDMMRYYSCLRWLEHIPFEKYQSSFPKGGE